MSNLVDKDGKVYKDGVLVTDQAEIDRVMRKVRNTLEIQKETAIARATPAISTPRSTSDEE